MTIEIKTSSFDSNYHQSELKGNSTHGEYIYHSIDIFNTITINSNEFWAVYQTGHTYDYNDYNYPSNKLTLTADGGTSEFLAKIDELYEEDFEDTQYILEFLEDNPSISAIIKTPEELWEVYKALNDNAPSLSHFLDPETYTEDPDDYITDNQEAGTVKPKKN